MKSSVVQTLIVWPHLNSRSQVRLLLRPNLPCPELGSIFFRSCCMNFLLYFPCTSSVSRPFCGMNRFTTFHDCNGQVAWWTKGFSRRVVRLHETDNIMSYKKFVGYAVWCVGDDAGGFGPCWLVLAVGSWWCWCGWWCWSWGWWGWWWSYRHQTSSARLLCLPRLVWCPLPRYQDTSPSNVTYLSCKCFVTRISRMSEKKRTSIETCIPTNLIRHAQKLT